MKMEVSEEQVRLRRHEQCISLSKTWEISRSNFDIREWIEASSANPLLFLIEEKVFSAGAVTDRSAGRAGWPTG